MVVGIAIEKIVSGGQSGVDRAALDVAMELGISCGGWCPRGRRAADGPIPPRYPLQETASAAYGERTRLNVRDSDGTLVLGRCDPVGGTRLAIEWAGRLDRPCLIVEVGRDAELAPVRRWLKRNGIRVLNVAGPREEQAPGIHGASAAFLRRLFTL